MIRTADFKVDFFNILSQDTADKLNAMTASEIAIITRRITNSHVNLDGCNKYGILNTLKNWLKYKEPAKSTEIDRYIITRQDESKFIAGKVYNGDISKDNYTIISRTAKTVIIIRNNNEYANNPRKCSILRQNKTEYIIYAGEFIYSFNENANAKPVLLEEKKTEPRVKFEIGQTYISITGYYDEYCRCERYAYFTVIARTDKTVTFVEEESLKPENIIIDANTGKRIYNNDFYKPARRNIEIDDNGVEKARLDVLYTFSAEKYKGSDNKKDSFIEGYGEIITVEAKEFQEPAELAHTAKDPEVKAIAAKTENNEKTQPEETHAPQVVNISAPVYTPLIQPKQEPPASFDIYIFDTKYFIERINNNKTTAEYNIYVYDGKNTVITELIYIDNCEYLARRRPLSDGLSDLYYDGKSHEFAAAIKDFLNGKTNNNMPEVIELDPDNIQELNKENEEPLTEAGLADLTNLWKNGGLLNTGKSRKTRKAKSARKPFRLKEDPNAVYFYNNPPEPEAVKTENNEATPAPVKKSITKKYESDEDASESAELAIKDLAKVDTPEEMRAILNKLTHRAIEYIAIKENINFSCHPAHKRSKQNLIDGIINTITKRNKRIDAGEELIIMHGVKLTPLVTARYVRNNNSEFVKKINLSYIRAMGMACGLDPHESFRILLEIYEIDTPYFDEEYYSDTSGDNSHPEQDIPEDHESDTAPAQEAEKVTQPAQVTAPTIKQEAKPVKTAKPATPKTRKINKDLQVMQEIINEIDALTPQEIISDQDKLNILCEDLCAVLSGMKKSQILEFAAQHKISLLSLQYVKKKTIKDIAGYICKKLAMLKTIEARQALTPKTNKPVEPQISPVARTSEPSKSNHTPTCMFGGQVILILEGDNFLFDFESEAA